MPQFQILNPKPSTEVTGEIAKLRSVAASNVGRHTDTRARLRQGHATIREALQVVCCIIHLLHVLFFRAELS